MTIRLTIISDTHDYCADFVLESINHSKPDILFHNGDMESNNTLHTYSTLVPTFLAVRGDKDPSLELPTRNVIKVGNICIGQLHGERPKHREKLSSVVNKVMRGRYYCWNNFAQDALSQFSEKLDILLTGHLHVPFLQRINNTVVLNPGAIIVNDRPHHLKLPTLTTLSIHRRSFEINFFMLKKGVAPIPLLVGRNGPLKDLSESFLRLPMCVSRMSSQNEI